jgi:subtilisin family serine protease
MDLGQRYQPAKSIMQPPYRLSILTAVLTLLLVGCGGGSSAADQAPTGGGGGGGGGGVTDPTGPEVVVQTTIGADISAIAAAGGLTVIDQFGQRPIYRLRLPVGGDAQATAAALALRTDVRFAEPNVEAETPESNKNSVWFIGGDAGVYATQWAPTALRLPSAHALSDGRGVRVAVLDTGIDASHPALAGRLARTATGAILGYDFVDDDRDPSEAGVVGNLGYGHGTHVAGLVALAAPGATLMPVRVLDTQGRGNAWVLAEALAWAVDPDGNPATDDGAHVINLSLGSTRETRLLSAVVGLANCEFDDDDDDDDFDDPGFDDDRTRCALGHGAAVLISAGNSGSDSERLYPAAEEVEGARAVTATTAQNRLAPFANRGSWITLAAPGEAIVSTVPGGGWGTWSGTSMAAPLAAGTAALVLGTPSPDPLPGTTALRQWGAEDLMKRLEDRAKPVCGASVKQIDALAAVTDTPASDPVCP